MIDLRSRPSTALGQSIAALLVASVLVAWAAASPAVAQSPDAEERWRDTLETGRSALASGNLTVAENFIRQAISQAMALSASPETNLPLAESYEAMAGIEARSDRMGRAEALMNQSIAIRRAALPPDHPDLGRAVLGFADLQRLGGQYDKADQLYRSSIETIAAALGPAHVLLVQANYGLALNEMAQGRIGSVDDLIAQATAVLGQQDDRVLRDNLLDFRPIADGYRAMGRVEDAEQVMRQAMDFYARHFSVDHPYYEATMMELGTGQLEDGRAEEARGTFDHGTDQMLLAFGGGSGRVAAVLEDIAELFKAHAYPDVTEAYYMQAMEVRRQTVGTTAADQIHGLVKLGDLSRERGDLVEAESYYRDAINLGETRFGADEVETAYAYSSMGLLLWGRGEVEDAARLWSQALAIYRKRLGPDHPNLATVAFNLGQLRHSQGAWTEAEALYREALDIRERVLGPAHPATLETINMYSLLLDRLDRGDEADRLRARAN
jgi:tetratricopeptide (TPR) repeat protein